MGILDMLGPAIGGLGSLASSGGTAFSGLLSFLMNQQRYDQGNNLFTQFGRNQIKPFTQATNVAANQFLPGGSLDVNPLNQQMASGAYDLMTGSNAELGALRDRVMSSLEGQGQQETKDINRIFGENKEEINAGNFANGMGGTTAALSALSGNNRTWGDTLGASGERTALMKANADQTLTGNVVNNSNSMWTNYMNTLNNNYNRSLGATQNRLGTMGTGIATEGSYLNNRLGWIGGVTDQYPSQANNLQLSQSLGMGAAPPVQYPSADSSGAWAGGGLSALGSVGGSVATATIIAAGFCVDLLSAINTPGGMKLLRNIVDGDKILIHGKARRVQISQQCRPHPEKSIDYIQIVSDLGSIRLSKDHIVGGRPAGDWELGDSIEVHGKSARIKALLLVPPFESGDLLIEGCDEYVANGFVVKSMFSHTGLSEKEIKARRNSLVVN